MSIMSVMTLNIGNPSIERVKRQISWIENRSEDVFVLTETKDSDGCNYLDEYFTNTGMTLFDLGRTPRFFSYFPKSTTGDLGVMILSKYRIIDSSTCFDADSIYYSRLLDVKIDFEGRNFGIMGLYVPSRDASQEKIARKKNFAIQYLRYLKEKVSSLDMPYIICGDLNILERNHKPKYPFFQNWEYDFYERFDHFGFADAFRLMHPCENEYSWVGRTNDGYRYDHCFISNCLSKSVLECSYVHETRKIPITDHSAMCLKVEY